MIGRVVVSNFSKSRIESRDFRATVRAFLKLLAHCMLGGRVDILFLHARRAHDDWFRVRREMWFVVDYQISIINWIVPLKE